MTIEMYCPVCCENTTHIDSRCNECGYYSNGDYARVVRNHRKLLGLTRKQMADKVGLKRETVYKYEKVWPSKKYYEQTKMLVIKAKGIPATL